MNVPLLDLKSQYAGLRSEIRAAMDEVCDAQYFILGPKVEEFERRVAEYCGTAYAVGLSSGTDALLAALMALNVGPGDAVVTTPYSFFATVSCIVRLGATPILADIDPATFNLDPLKVAETLRHPPERFRKLRIKALLPVHLYGQCADMDALLDLARRHDLAVIEDAAQAIGAEYPSAGGAKRAGSMGAIGCFSFFPSKNLGGFGDGGMAVTQDEALAHKLKQLRNHGMEPKYYHAFVGGNFRLDALQAAVLTIKLRHLERWHAARRRNADLYTRLFAGTDVKTPAAVYRGSGIGNFHIYNQYIVRVPGRVNVMKRLKAAEVGHEIYYPLPLHLQECFKSLGYHAGDFPASEQAAADTLALPVYPELTPDMQAFVVDQVVGR